MLNVFSNWNGSGLRVLHTKTGPVVVPGSFVVSFGILSHRKARGSALPGVDR